MFTRYVWNEMGWTCGKNGRNAFRLFKMVNLLNEEVMWKVLAVEFGVLQFWVVFKIMFIMRISC